MIWYQEGILLVRCLRTVERAFLGIQGLSSGKQLYNVGLSFDFLATLGWKCWTFLQTIQLLAKGIRIGIVSHRHHP